MGVLKETREASSGHLEYSEGDVLAVPWGSVIVHSCNIKDGWGSGVAGALKEALPAANELYDMDRNGKNPSRLLGRCLLIPPVREDVRNFRRNKTASEKEDSQYGRYWVACLYIKKRGGPPNPGSGQVDLLVHFKDALADLKNQLSSERAKDTAGPPGKLYCPPVNSGIFKIPWAVSAKVLENSGLDFHVKYLKGQDPRKVDRATRTAVSKLMENVREFAPRLKIQHPFEPQAGKEIITLDDPTTAPKDDPPIQTSSGFSSPRTLRKRRADALGSEAQVEIIHQSIEEGDPPGQPLQKRRRNERLRYPGPRADPRMLQLAQVEYELDVERRKRGPITRSKLKTFAKDNPGADLIILDKPPTNVPKPAEKEPWAREAEHPDRAREATDMFGGLSKYPHPRLWLLRNDERYTLHPVASTSYRKAPPGYKKKGPDSLYGKHMRGPQGELLEPEPSMYQIDDVGASLPDKYTRAVVPESKEEKQITGREPSGKVEKPGILDIPGVPPLLLAEKFDAVKEYRRWVIWKEKKDAINAAMQR